MSDDDFRRYDDLRRLELPPQARAVADTLDEWLFRMHGIQSGAHHVGAFLSFLAERGLAINASGPSVAPEEQR